MERIKGRIIQRGNTSGELLFSKAPISFFGGVDPETGTIIEQGHPLLGVSIANKILAFPYGKGSTVGSYILARLKKKKVAPKAMLLSKCEPIVAVGAIIAEIPCLDLIEIQSLSNTHYVEVLDDEVVFSNEEEMQGNKKKSSNKKDRLFILKLGGSAITYKDENIPKVHEDILHQAGNEIKKAIDKGSFSLCIIHGAGPFGHALVDEYGLRGGIISPKHLEGFLKTHYSVSNLNKIIRDILFEEGVHVFPFQPSAMIIQENKRIISFNLEPIKKLLTIHENVVPLLYGDMVVDTLLGASVVSGDQIATYLAKSLSATEVLMGCDVDGVFSSDPKENTDSFLYTKITSCEFQDIIKGVGGVRGKDVTGGLRGKLESIQKDLKGIPAFIFNVLTKKNLENILLGESVRGTKVLF